MTEEGEMVNTPGREDAVLALILTLRSEIESMREQHEKHLQDILIEVRELKTHLNGHEGIGADLDRRISKEPLPESARGFSESTQGAAATVDNAEPCKAQATETGVLGTTERQDDNREATVNGEAEQTVGGVRIAEERHGGDEMEPESEVKEQAEIEDDEMMTETAFAPEREEHGSLTREEAQQRQLQKLDEECDQVVVSREQSRGGSIKREKSTAESISSFWEARSFASCPAINKALVDAETEAPRISRVLTMLSKFGSDDDRDGSMKEPSSSFSNRPSSDIGRLSSLNGSQRSTADADTESVAAGNAADTGEFENVGDTGDAGDVAAPGVADDADDVGGAADAGKVDDAGEAGADAKAVDAGDGSDEIAAAGESFGAVEASDDVQRKESDVGEACAETEPTTTAGLQESPPPDEHEGKACAEAEAAAVDAQVSESVNERVTDTLHAGRTTEEPTAVESISERSVTAVAVGESQGIQREEGTGPTEALVESRSGTDGGTEVAARAEQATSFSSEPASDTASPRHRVSLASRGSLVGSEPKDSETPSNENDFGNSNRMVSNAAAKFESIIAARNRQISDVEELTAKPSSPRPPASSTVEVVPNSAARDPFTRRIRKLAITDARDRARIDSDISLDPNASSYGSSDDHQRSLTAQRSLSSEQTSPTWSSVQEPQVPHTAAAGKHGLSKLFKKKAILGRGKR